MQDAVSLQRVVVAASAAVLCSCGGQTSETVHSSPVAIERSSPKFVPPVYTNVEAYINNYAYGPRSGGHWRWSNATPVQVVRMFGTEWNGTKYAMELQYKGSELGKDVYVANITRDGTAVTAADMTLTYDGTDIEIWRDNRVRIGLRPREGE